MLDAIESFCRLINKEIYLIELLFYHSAIIYERRNAGYLMGREIMEEIQAGFSEGGPLRARRLHPFPPARRRLQGARPQLGPSRWCRRRQWGGVKMYKAAGRYAGIDTFPGGAY